MGYSPWGHKRVRHNLATTQQTKKLLLDVDICVFQSIIGRREHFRREEDGSSDDN